MQPPTPSHVTTLARKTDDWFRRATAALLSQVPCRPGCSQCCVGLFPITRLDVRLLQEGMAHLSADQRERIAGRAAQQVAALEAAFPVLTSTPSVDEWSDEDIDGAVNTFEHAPCPALDEEGLCSVYVYRPLTCRSMGIPMRQEGMTHGACDVQTFVPVRRLSASLQAEEQALANLEAVQLAALSEVPAEGEEVLLPYGFVSGGRCADAHDGTSAESHRR